jgi:hypothetical protein
VAILIRRLEEQDEVEPFDCGDEPLNNYLKRHAWASGESAEKLHRCDLCGDR